MSSAPIVIRPERSVHPVAWRVRREFGSRLPALYQPETRRPGSCLPEEFIA